MSENLKKLPLFFENQLSTDYLVLNIDDPVVADMEHRSPSHILKISQKKAVENAIKMMKESGVDALKLQLGKEGSNIIKAVADAKSPKFTAFPVCAIVI